MASLTLCMIVKNEARVIERCLDSVRPLIDYVVIEDTGSTDGTQDIIRSWLKREGIAGHVIEEPWRDFAYNRSHVLAQVRRRGMGDYAFIMDADDHAVFDPAFDPDAFKALLGLDEYSVELRQHAIAYRRTLICSTAKPYRYRGVLHEYLECADGPISSGRAEGFYIVSSREGARSQDPEKYAKDAAVLARALESETDDFLISRYTFYLAQSYRDAGQRELALEYYMKRADLGFWSAEKFYSLYQAGKIMEQQGADINEVLAVYEKAFACQPTRAESMHAAAKLCRREGQFGQALDHALRGLGVIDPENCLFVEKWIYAYGLIDEVAVSAYWSGDYALSVAACQRLLREEVIPAEQRERVQQNLEFGLRKLSETVESPAQRALLFARRSDRIGDGPAVTLEHFETALRTDDSPEILVEAARYCRTHDLFREGYEFAFRGIARLNTGYCSQSGANSALRRSLLDELSVNAYWIGKYKEAAEASVTLLEDRDLSADDRDRVRKNRDFALEMLGASAEAVRGSNDRGWAPASPMGGTEIMIEGLKSHVGPALDKINLAVNQPSEISGDGRPHVVWIHHNVDQSWVQWCRDPALVAKVDIFVFVSHWQLERFVTLFGLPRAKCAVLRNATDLPTNCRQWRSREIWKCGYASTPFRGLALLLDAWDLLAPSNAELHIWSSMKIYGVDDSKYQPLYDKARSLPGVFYHGIVPNDQLRLSFQDLDFFTYPCVFEETSCLAVIEAMAAGCRVIAPALGALPETTAGYGRLYPWNSDEQRHIRDFADVLRAEFETPWKGRLNLVERQQEYCRDFYSWGVRSSEWRDMIQQWTGLFR